MKVIKPNWVKHTDEKDRKSPIFSCSVHPDGTRLATGGLDKKVKIWSTLPIFDSDAADDEGNHKLLCTMSSHTGSVLAVRWAHHGRFLASGSDDMVMVIWGIDPDGGGRVFGSDEVNVENWKALTRLVGHTADIIDIAWSRDDSMMASVGLDKMVWIWDGYSFDRIRKLDLHGDFVKGVCWDPVGNFLATQSDDKTVKIWDTGDWSLVQSVDKPFANSPKSTFFRRLSWSPDGAFIAASNAMNGPVFVAAVIEREGWNADISFVGHANTIQVAAFNPRLFFRSNDQPGRATASCMVALGADDFSISIWRNTMHKPLAVLHDIFNRPLLDLCWANDGYHLYGCSADGTICAFSFDPQEFPELAEIEKTEVVLREYGCVPRSRPVPRPLPAQPAGSTANGFGASTTSGGHVNVLHPRKGNKSGPSRRRIDLGGDSRQLHRNGFGPPPPDHRHDDAFSSAPIQPFASPSRAQASTARMFQDAHSAFANGDADSAGPSRMTGMTGQKRKASLIGDDGGRVPRGRTMGSSAARQVGEVREIRAPRVAIAFSGSSGGSGGRTLPVPRIQTVLRAKPNDSSDETLYIEAQSAESLSGRNRVAYCQGGQDLWLDFLPSAIMVMAITERFCAVGCEDGSIVAYSPAGRHLFNVRLEAPCVEMSARKDALVIVTSNCMCRVFDMKGRGTSQPTSLSHLLESSFSQPNTTSLDIVKLDVTANGVPIFITSEPSAHAWDIARGGWVIISSPWWLEYSPLSERRSRGGPSGPLAEIESEVERLWAGRPSASTGGGGGGAGGDRPQWWDETMEMGHLDNRMRASELLQSKDEYKYWVGKYASVLSRGGFRERAEELIKEFLGPIYHHVGKNEWCPTIVGWQKRELAKQVLSTLAQSTGLSGLAQHYQGVLRAIANEEAGM